MRRVMISVMIGTLSVLGQTALASKSGKRTKPAALKTEFALPIIQSDLQTPETADFETKERSALEFQASLWTPENFSRPTYQGGTSAFERGSLPLLSVSHVSALTSKRSRPAVFLKVGAAGTNLKRSGAQTQFGRRQESEQSLTILSLRLGAELHDRKYFADSVQPVLGFSLLPTVALAARSQIEDQVNEQGLPMEATLGVLIHPHSLMGEKWKLDQSSLGVFAHAVFGDIGPSSMNGLGAAIAFRMNL